MAASAPAISSLKPNGVLLQLIERLLPAAGAQAPAVARFEPGEAVLRQGRAEVVAVRLGEGEELRRHDHTDGVQADILAAGIAASVTVEAGQGLERAGLQRAAQDVDRWCASRPRSAFFGCLIEHGPPYHLEIALSSGPLHW